MRALLFVLAAHSPRSKSTARIAPFVTPTPRIQTMLRSLKDFGEYAIGATDGVIGHVKDLYFDDTKWVVRYLVVDTNAWLPGRQVLISPFAVGEPNWADKILPVPLTRDQVKDSPDIDTDKPVSRQYEVQYLGYYGYPNYWDGTGLWGNAYYPEMTMPGYAGFGLTPRAGQPEAEKIHADAEAARHQNDDPHLRSCKALVGYHIEATDGDIGHVSGMLVDEQTWAIRYFIVDTSNWWFGHQVLIAPQWIDDMSWVESTVSLNLSRQTIQDAPAYDPAAPLSHEQEAGIHEHYGLPAYWASETPRPAHT
jgi:hypothetical protein